MADIRGIVFTDMVGSSQLRSRLGDDPADDLRKAHDDLLGAAVAAHGGTVLRWTGDGLKASFASASSAVAAALDMQRAVERYGRRADAIAPFQIRIGVSVGEVTEEDDDIHGVAVIEGARLEAMAGPGEILATDLVIRLGQRRLDVGFEEVGSHHLKGLDQPVTVFRVIDTSSGRDARAVPKAVALDRRYPLVGRDEPLEAGLRMWEQVQSGSAATVLVAGPPGIGKSRLVAQLVDRAHADGALVVAGVCDSDLAVPYKPFAMAFSEVQTADDELSRALDAGTGPLAPLFPGRRSGRFEDAGPSARFELFESVVALVGRLAEEQPVVLVLEDLQWAAASTVHLLLYLVRNATGARVLVLGTYRGVEVGVDHPLHDVLVESHTSSDILTLELGPLQLPDVIELVAGRVEGAPRERVRDFAGRVCAESGGSPFFVCELLDHLSATGGLERVLAHGETELPIPDSVREVVGQRLARLPAGSAELLSTAAVIGLTFDLDLLSHLSSQPVDAVLGTLEQVERVALVREVEAGRFTFAHAILRSTLLDHMSATRQALAHRHVAEAIEELRAADHDELAHHWLAAGVEDKAHAHLELAAGRDLEALAYESAAEKYQTVLDYSRRATSTDGSAIARASLGLGLARRALGQPDYIAVIEEAGRLGRRLRDADVVAEAALASVWPGTFFVTAGSTQTSLVELCEDALALVDDADPRRPRILSTLAAHLTFDEDRDRRVALLAEAHELARGVGDPELIGSVLVAEYQALWDPSTLARRAEIAQELARMARASGEVDLEFFAGFFAAIGACETGDVDGARRHLEALAGPVSASQNFYFGFLVERLAVSLDILTGREGVQGEIDAVAERYAGTHADTSGSWSLQTGGLALQRGELGVFVPALRDMIEHSTIAVNWQAPYGLALLGVGDRDGAMAVLDEFQEPPFDFFWLTTVQILSEVAVGLGRRDVVERLFEALLPYRDQLGVTDSGSLCLGLVARTLGDLALALDRHATAIDLLDDAVARADAMGAPFEAVKSRRLLAQALLASGQRLDRIGSLVDTATALAERHGFRTEQEALAQLPLEGSPQVG